MTDIYCDVFYPGNKCSSDKYSKIQNLSDGEKDQYRRKFFDSIVSLKGIGTIESEDNREFEKFLDNFFNLNIFIDTSPWFNSISLYNDIVIFKENGLKIYVTLRIGNADPNSKLSSLPLDVLNMIVSQYLFAGPKITPIPFDLDYDE